MSSRGSFVVRIALTWLALAVLAVACATLPPAKPVTSVGQIAGKWQGTVTTGGGPQSATTTINPDGTYSVVLGNQTFPGKMTVADGKLRSRGDKSGAMGTWSLHEGDGKRVPSYKADDGRVTGELTPAK
jgi:hypothetical protein